MPYLNKVFIRAFYRRKKDGWFLNQMAHNLKETTVEGKANENKDD